ncbi:MAG: hypothetical protein HQL58_06185 [Magnetococcales bacterium]|nr:hypothetical protein [Magnetococcales bacterium]
MNTNMEDKQQPITFISVSAATQIIYAGPEHPCYQLAEHYLRQRFDSRARQSGTNDDGGDASHHPAQLLRAVQRQQAIADFWTERIEKLHAASRQQLEQIRPSGESSRLLLQGQPSRIPHTS